MVVARDGSRVIIRNCTRCVIRTELVTKLNYAFIASMSRNKVTCPSRGLKGIVHQISLKIETL